MTKARELMSVAIPLSMSDYAALIRTHAGRRPILVVTRGLDSVGTGRQVELAAEALRAAGIPYPGHTEIFTARTNAPKSCMMLTSESITCSFVTAHVGYRDVPGLLSIERIVDTIELTSAALTRIRGRAPKLLICGLNPHAGEEGTIGGEERTVIAPAVERLRAQA